MSAGAARRKWFGRGLGMVSRELVAPGVWLVRGGFPKRIFNVYLVEDAGGVTVFDAGMRAMARGIREASADLGGIGRVVLGHAHEDHRGAAPSLGAPIWCHLDERVEAESSRKPTKDQYDFSKVRSPVVRAGFRVGLPLFDGGPCEIERTLTEGEMVSGFQVVHLPGHSPGQIALWRDDDRLALTTDCFYTLDPTRVTLPFGAPQCTCLAFDEDNEQARESMRKLAQMEPAQAWPGHARPAVGHVRAQLERALREPPY